jgi:orotate phosphoribosyltransferase
VNKKELYKLLKDCGVIMEGHFLLTSGRHSNLFMQCSQLLQYPEKTAQICRLMAQPFLDKGVETVIGPAMGGIILSYETARQLQARAVFTEQAGDKMVLRRGFSIKKRERVLIVEDAVTTGGSVQKVIDILRNTGADLVGLSVLIDRAPNPPNFGLEMKSLLKVDVESYFPGECPLCRSDIPLQSPKN